MTSYLDTPIFGIMLTIIVFATSQYINKKLKLAILNPLLISIISIISFLLFWGIDYEVYNKGGNIISFFLGPATIVLAVPLFKQIKLLKNNFFPIIMGVFVGSLTGIISIIVMSKLFNIDEVLMLSLIPKATTTAIAMEISRNIGGISSLTIAFVSVAGVTGYIISPWILKLFKIDNKIAKGIAIGTASHAVGTAKAMELGEKEGAMSSLAISIAGLMTVVLAPLILGIISLSN